jgi:hypothetical protein
MATKFGGRLAITAAKSSDRQSEALDPIIGPFSGHTLTPVICRVCSAGFSSWRRRRAQPNDQPQDLSEHLSRHRDLSHLEGDVTAMADDLRADLDQLLLEAGERPRLCCFRHRQRPHEIPEIIGQHMELKTHGIGGEGTARQPGPLDRVLALLNVLLARTAPVVERTIPSAERAKLVTTNPTRG